MRPYFDCNKLTLWEGNSPTLRLKAKWRRLDVNDFRWGNGW
jgi:hypothetical protein